MTDGCLDRRFAEMLHAYELGMLTDEQRQEFEIHLLECPSCNERARQFGDTARVLRDSPRVRDAVRRLVESPVAEAVTPIPKSPPSKRVWRVVVPSLLAAAAVFVILLLTDWQVDIRPTQEAVAVENRLVVLHFDNIQDPGDPQRLGEIIANLLITDLSESQYLQVVSSQRLYDIIQSLGGTDTEQSDRELAAQIARQAQAELILTGSILQVTPRLEISAQLIEGVSGRVLAAQRVTGDPTETVFPLVDRLTIAVKHDLALPPAAQDEPDKHVAEMTTHSAEAYRYYLDGLTSYRKLYYAEAASSFTRAAECDSTFAMAYYYLAEIKDPSLIAQAITYIDHAGQREQYYIRSRQAVLAGDLTQAAVELQALVRRYPDEKDALFELGRLDRIAQDYDQSRQYFERVLALDSAHKLTYNELAYVYNFTGDYQQALWAIDKYISLAPGEANPYDTRGDLYARHGELDRAIASYREGLAIKPDYVNSIVKLGTMFLYRREYDSARVRFQEYLSYVGGQNQAEARLCLAAIPLYQGKFREALRLLDLGLQTEAAEGAAPMANMYHVLKYIQKCNIFVEQGRPDSAVREFEKYLAIDQRDFPDSLGEFPELYVELLTENNEITRARAVAEDLHQQLLRRERPLRLYWYAKGCIELADGDPDTAAAYFEQAMGQITDFKTYFMLARAGQKAGRLTEAARIYETLLSSYSPSRGREIIRSVKTHYFLAQVYEQDGHIERAIEHYEAFLKIWENADQGLTAITDARQRLQQLKNRS